MTYLYRIRNLLILPFLYSFVKCSLQLTFAMAVINE